MFTNNNELLALVKFNDGVAMVFRNPIKLEYHRVSTGTIVGTDGVFFNGYYYDAPSRSFQAFGGREFTIKLANGEEVKCNGQWWSGLTTTATEMFGDINHHCTVGTLDDLRQCYVYGGYSGSKAAIDKLIESYTGRIYEYYEYEKIVKACKPNKLLKKIMGEHTVIDIDYKTYRYYIIDGRVYYNSWGRVDENFKYIYDGKKTEVEYIKL